jgi:hypothetical protein
MVCAIIGAAPRSASANSTGIAAYSGMNGTTCTLCHKSMLPYQMKATFNGPTFLKPGAVGNYNFSMPAAGTATKSGGLDVSASGGTLAPDATDPTTKILGGELVHNAPKPVSSGLIPLTWKFQWTAPSVVGTYTFYGAGLVANGDKATTGDTLAVDTFQVSVGNCQAAADCDDKNACTMDSCNQTTKTCINTKINNCCLTVAECDDGNVCTTDTCNALTHTCGHAPVQGCCTTDAQCLNDNDPCTKATCDLVAHKCGNVKVVDCCSFANPSCDDGNKCTTDQCSFVTNTCSHAPTPNCCKADTDCADTNPCTTDTCTVATGTCSNTKTAGCCLTAVECDDKNACTADACTNNKCVSTPVAGCCAKDTDCDDGNPCTTDTCAKAVCAHSPVPGCVPPDAGVPDAKPAGDGNPPSGDSQVPSGDSNPPSDAPQPGVDWKAGDSGTPPTPSSDGCCRVSHARSATSGIPALLLAAVLLGLALRRRR